MSIDVIQVRLKVVRPALLMLADSNLLPYSRAAENLVLGTCMVESAGKYIVQLNEGPAKGPCQMEPFTHDDIWANWLSHPARRPLADVLRAMQIPAKIATDADEMAGNWYYAFAMCRVFYRRLSAPLPAERDYMAMAQYWKRWYNTALGKGTIAKALPHFEDACRI